MAAVVPNSAVVFDNDSQIVNNLTSYEELAFPSLPIHQCLTSLIFNFINKLADLAGVGQSSKMEKKMYYVIIYPNLRSSLTVKV